MPEYSQPLPARQIASIAQILKNYPEFSEERRRWFDRVYIDMEDGHGVRPLSDHWKKGGPKWLRWALWAVNTLGHKTIRPGFYLVVKPEDIVPKHIQIKNQPFTVKTEKLIADY